MHTSSVALRNELRHCMIICMSQAKVPSFKRGGHGSKKHMNSGEFTTRYSIQAAGGESTREDMGAVCRGDPTYGVGEVGSAFEC